MTNVVRVSNIEKAYGTKKQVVPVLKNISFTVEKGEFLSIMGPSGSGKTTLLNCLSTLDSVTSGTIEINGQQLERLKGKKLDRFRAHELGFIFQDFNLLDTLTAFENIALALTIQGVAAKEIKERVGAVASRLGITEVLTKFPYEMSGGQKQRVAAARAIIGNPSLVLADEPTGALDSKSARQLLESLVTLNTELETTILMVTHDAFSASYTDRILFLKDGEVFSELHRGDDDRETFFHRILEAVSVLGGDEDAH